MGVKYLHPDSPYTAQTTQANKQIHITQLTVSLSSLLQHLQMLQLLLAEGDHQRAVLLIAEVQVVVQGREHLVARPAELGAH